MFRKLMLLLAAPMVLGAQQMTDTTLHPITVQDAVRLAEQNNVSAITAGNQIRTANYNVRAARAELYPTATVSAGQSKSGGQRLGQSGTLVPYNPSWTYNTGFSSNMTLFDGGRAFADIRTQKANVVAAEAGQTTTQFTIALNVKTQYNLILAAKEQEAAAQVQLQLAQQQLATSIAKVNAGAANVSDSLRGVLGVGNAQLSILTAQNNLRVASAELTRTVGTPYFVTADYADTVEHKYAPVDSASIVQMALNGPTVKQSIAQLNSSLAALRAAKAAYLPSISASFNYGGNGTGVYTGPEFPYTHTIGLSLNYPLFNRFSRENTAAVAQINIENAQATLKDQQLAAQQNIVTYIGSLHLAEESMRIQELSVQASEEDLRVVQQRYALGAGTLLDVLTSQSNLITARQQLIQARLTYRNARAQIESVIGRDLP
ncbi:MAG TPA: TolC family protein [Gemmatimonadaceae bacterium]